MLWKFARLNALPGHLLASQATHDFVDPYEGVEAYRETVNFHRLRQALCLPLKTLRLSVLPKSRRGIASPYLRFCRRCPTRSYHSLIHQLEPVQHCPIHGSWLEVECCHCAHATPYMLNARLLDAPFRCSNCRRAGFALAEPHKLYACHDRLLEHKQGLFDHLTRRWRDLFNASFEVLLYDLTSTYFEAEAPSDKEVCGAMATAATIVRIACRWSLRWW